MQYIILKLFIILLAGNSVKLLAETSGCIVLARYLVQIIEI